MSRCVPEEIKKLIRSVLLSVVGGIKVSDVPRQYKLITNENLNWTSLGYKNLIELLREIPDVARFVVIIIIIIMLIVSSLLGACIHRPDAPLMISEFGTLYLFLLDDENR